MAVAIRTITRIQDADDVNVTLGAGVDEYALSWDNDTALFVLRAVAGVYLLATGATTGASASAQPFTVGISLTDTTTATTGVVFKGSDRFIHNFHHPTGDTAVPAGLNTFVGVNAGNFTMGSTATLTTYASNNVGVGHEALLANTTGYQNTAVGQGALKANTSGYYNMAFGSNVLCACTEGHDNVGVGNGTLYKLTTGNYNVMIGSQAGTEITTVSNSVAIGYRALFTATVGEHVAIGSQALQNTTNGRYNTAVGLSAGLGNTTGGQNVMIGVHAGRYHANGSTALTDAENSVYIGGSSRGYDNSDSNSIVIGHTAIGLGANTTVIGNTSTTLTRLYGKIGNVDAPGAQLHVDQASSTGAVPVLTVDQADVSEEFIRFIGTSTTDASQSLVDAADMEDPGAIVGWLKIYVQDDQGTNPITDGAYYVPFYSAPTHSP